MAMGKAYKKRTTAPKITGTKTAVRPVKPITAGAITGGTGSITKQRITKAKGGGPVYQTPGFKPGTRTLNRKKY